jgi:hypothetical protein
MQTDEGYFYNFIRDDHTINSVYRTSTPGPNWWTWRALWALSEAHKYFEKKDTLFAETIYKSFEKGILKSISDYNSNENTEAAEGFETPIWLPAQSGSDQAAIFNLNLLYYFQVSGDSEALDIIKSLCKGIMMMQINDETSDQYGAFRSWRNNWHAWGNLQSYSLLKVYKQIKDEAMLQSAILEINSFYRYLVEGNFLNELELRNINDRVSLISVKQFPQIAYGIRPMVYACIEAFNITGDSSYAILAGQIGKWLIGKNPAAKFMYDMKTGKCFDGIISDNEINFNSGAESTIEALMTIIELSKNDLAFNAFINSGMEN